MCRFFLNTRLIGVLLATLFVQGFYPQTLCAQELSAEDLVEEELSEEQLLDQRARSENVTAPQTNNSALDNAPAITPKPPATNSARNAVVNLQTTVTGNQEQPRVLYILPWQSPATEAIGFESLESEQSTVFGHVERDELRRQLEAEGVFD